MILNDAVLLKLYSLIDELKKSKEYTDLKKSYDDLMNNEESKAIIDEFIKSKELYSYGETKESIERLKNAKKALYTNEFYILYKDKLEAYNVLASEIEKSINSHLYGRSVKEVFDLR